MVKRWRGRPGERCLVSPSVPREAQISGDADKGITSYTPLGSGEDDVTKILPGLNDKCTAARKQ